MSDNGGVADTYCNIGVAYRGNNDYKEESASRIRNCKQDNCKKGDIKEC